MKKKVLIVDDDPVVVEVVEEILKFHSYEVTTASLGNEGLTKCKHLKPDVVIMDIMMPDMVGHQVAEEIKNDPATSHIPIIFLTGVIKTEELPEDHMIGGQYILGKPCNSKKLISLLRNVLSH